MPSPEAAVVPAVTTPEGGTGIRYAVLCSPYDESGPWVLDTLRRRGVAGARLVTVEELVYSTRIVHRQTTGGVTTEVTLPDGAVLGPELCAVLNRVTAVPTGHWAATPESERRYAEQETYALLTSVLAGLPGAVNPGGPRGLPGPWLTQAEWLCEAGRAGLPGVGYRSARTPADEPVPGCSLVVAGPAVLAPEHLRVAVPDPVAAGCRTLAARLDVQVLGLDFVVEAGTWRFAGGNPVPDLRWTGDAGAAAIVDLLLSPGAR